MRRESYFVKTTKLQCASTDYFMFQDTFCHSGKRPLGNCGLFITCKVIQQWRTKKEIYFLLTNLWIFSVIFRLENFLNALKSAKIGMKPPKLVLYGRSIVCRNGTSVIWENWNLVRALEIIIFKMGISYQFFILSHPSITVMHRDCVRACLLS